MFDWILKLLFTVLTLSIGFQGGEVTPLFSIGASLGFVLGSLTGLPPIVCAALGYAAVFGSATNTLLAPVLIGMEVFGVENGLAFFAVCLVAFLVNGNPVSYTHLRAHETRGNRHRNGLFGKNPLTLTLVHGL